MLEVVFGAGPGSPFRPFMDFHDGDFVHFLSLPVRFFFGQRLRMSSTTAAMWFGLPTGVHAIAMIDFRLLCRI